MALLIAVAVICIGVALSYPIRYKMELDSNNSELEDLSSMRRRVMEEQHIGEEDTDGWPEEIPTEVPAEQEPPVEQEPTTEQEPPTDQEPTVVQEPPAEQVLPIDEVLPEETLSPDAPSAVIVPAQTEVPPEQPPVGTPRVDVSETMQVRTEATGETPEPASTQSVEEGRTSAPTPAQPRAMGETPEPTAAPTDGLGITPAPTGESSQSTEVPVVTPGLFELMLNDVIVPTDTPAASSTPVPVTPSPSPTPDRSLRDDPDTYKAKAKVKLDESKILPELKEIYALNHHLVGWLYIDDTNIDYPVVQNKEDRTFYLNHDFYGKSNANGQIMMEDKCDPWTPSYNLVLSGHHMNSGAMFGKLGKYKDKAYWETHKIVEFDTLMARKRYVVFAAFYSADYNENEKGFRYSADIQYKMDADLWLGEIQANQIYETGIKAEFGDEFITLTTCDHSRRSNGRFVVVARRIREGEKIQ